MAATLEHTEHEPSAGDHLADAPQRNTTRLDRRVALDLLAGEVGHELAHTLTFLRCLTEEEVSSLTPEEGRMAQNQIERLQRMLRHLRKLSLPPPAREPVLGLEILRRAASDLDGLLARRNITLTWVTPERLTLRTDAPLFCLLVRDLLTVVVRDAQPSAAVGVEATLPSGSAGGVLQIWRSSSGATRPLASHPADPWAAMLSDEADLGLALCQRVARTLGWELAVTTSEGSEGLRLLIPAASFCLESEP